jgi:hypothetical protein
MATNHHRDDAIEARFTDTNRGKLAVAVAGIGRGGTRIAGEFLTGANDLVQLNRASQNAEDKKNVEVVLSTQMIACEPGTPSPGSTGQLNFQVAKTERAMRASNWIMLSMAHRRSKHARMGLWDRSTKRVWGRLTCSSA